MHTLDVFCITIVLDVIKMAFKINTNKIDTENKTIRFPIPLINKIENAIKDKNVSFSKFVIQACEYALKDLEIKKEKQISMLK